MRFRCSYAERSPTKAKGDVPCGRIAHTPSDFFEDLVRFQITTLFSRNYSGLTGSARVSLTLPLSQRLLEFPRCHRRASIPLVAARVSLPNLVMAIVYSLLPGRFLFLYTVGVGFRQRGCQLVQHAQLHRIARPRWRQLSIPWAYKHRLKPSI